MPVAATPSRQVALHAADVRDAEPGREIRRLAVGLLDPAPARVARDVEHRRERVPGAGRHHLLADHDADALDQLGIPRRGEPDRLRELGRVARAQPGGALLVHDRRDPEPRVLDEVALDRVREHGALARCESGRRADARDLADAVLQPAGGALGREPSSRAKRSAPHATELRELLVERHTRKKRVEIHDGILTRSCDALLACARVRLLA